MAAPIVDFKVRWRNYVLCKRTLLKVVNKQKQIQLKSRFWTAMGDVGTGIFPCEHCVLNHKRLGHEVEKTLN